MKTRSSMIWLLALSLGPSGLGCVSVYLSFPEKEVREAAEDIVQEVRPDAVNTENPGTAEPTQEGRVEILNRTGTALAAFARPAGAAAPIPEEKDAKGEKKIDLDRSTPVIKKIKEALKKRFPQLVPYYEKGALGEARTGYLVLRNTPDLGLKEKRDLEALLKAENEDRENLYKELARANQIDEADVTRIAEIFSAEWQKKSKPGWWIEVEKKKWVQKPKPDSKEPKRP